MEGVNLLVLGMGFVFIFLVFLVFATNVMSKMICRHVAKTQTPEVPLYPEISQPASIDDAQLIAVLTAAVHCHRAKHSQS
ncbi:oxaloacetate decarboxylase subunit gamma [Vibrio mangrovi]|nr:oxaloacetate decarboxylase subunit gamma [Vibrio mangrovi]